MPRPKRVLIFTAAFGGGHNSAAKAVSEYFRRHHSGRIETRVVDFVEKFAPALNAVAKFAYERSTQLFPETYGALFEASNRVPTTSVAQDMLQTAFSTSERYVYNYRPDAVLSVHPFPGGMTAEMKDRHGFYCATAITDYGAHMQWVHANTDVYFAASEEVRDDLAGRGIPSERVAVTGIPIDEAFATAVSRDEARGRLGLHGGFTALLTSASGTMADLKGVTKSLAALDMQLIAVAGRSKRLYKRLQPLESQYPNLKVLGFVEDMPTVMRSADVLVGKAGGLTVAEALAVGVPMIIFNPFRGQEEYNVDYLVNYGAGLPARDEDDVVGKLTFLSRHPERLNDLARSAASLGRPNASRDICEHLLEVLD